MMPTSSHLRQSTPGPLDESLATLALLAMRHTGADGYVYFCQTETGGLVRWRGYGTFIHEDALSGHDSQLAASFPLRLNGAVDAILAFVFPTKERFDAAQPRLKPLAATIEKVWVAQSVPQTYRTFLECIIDLETELLDSKIVSRARGVLSDETHREDVDAIMRHVESVLRPSLTFRTLTDILGELQKETEERDWAGRAKSILQRVHGMSEAEAHSYLRKSSRQSRKPFIEIAKELVGEKSKSD